MLNESHEIEGVQIQAGITLTVAEWLAHLTAVQEVSQLQTAAMPRSWQVSHQR